MKFSDLIALAKAGYKPGEVKELLSLGDNGASGAEKADEILPKEEEQPEQQNAQQKEAEEPEDNGAPSDDDKIKDLEAQITALKAELKKAQKDNSKKDISGTEKKDPQEVLNEIARSFM